MTLFADDIATAPRVLALDLSITASGICRPDGATATLKPTSDGDNRLAEIVHNIGLDIDMLGGVDLVAIEDLPPTRAFSTAKLGMVHGAVRVDLMRRGTPYLLVTPAQIKTYATGKGAGKGTDKTGLAVALAKRTGLEPQDENQVDARWLWMLALDLAGHPVIPLPQTHRRALDKLTLPTGATP